VAVLFECYVAQPAPVLPAERADPLSCPAIILSKMTAMRRGDFPPMNDNAATRPSPSVG
jgi:hypothetical protein